MVATGICKACNWYSQNVPVGDLLRTEEDGTLVFAVVQPFECGGCGLPLIEARVEPPANFPEKFFKNPIHRKGIE